MRYFVSIDGSEHVIDVERLPDGRCRITTGRGRSFIAEVTRGADGSVVRVGDRVFDLVLDGEGRELDAYASGRRHRAVVDTLATRQVAAARRQAAAAGGSVVTSPMPGKVVQVLVQPGQTVTADAPVVVIEAMKMENQLAAGADGVVAQVLVKAGDNVESGMRLLVIE